MSDLQQWNVTFIYVFVENVRIHSLLKYMTTVLSTTIHNIFASSRSGW